jgi:hypothetical protein
LASSHDWWYVMVFLNTSPSRMWILSRDDVVTKPRHDIQSKKFMLKSIWNPSGFYVVERLLNDPKKNNHYFVTHLLILFE